MSIFSAAAIYFVVWWITLFAILPFGIRTQGEEHEVTLGTSESAPARIRTLRILILTTLVSALICGAYVFVTRVLGYTVDSIPRFVPKFD